MRDKKERDSQCGPEERHRNNRAKNQKERQLYLAEDPVWMDLRKIKTQSLGKITAVNPIKSNELPRETGAFFIIHLPIYR